MSTLLLEQICNEVDARISRNKVFGVEDVVKGLDISNAHDIDFISRFTNEYIDLAKSYFFKHGNLTSINYFNIDWKRVAMHGAIFGFFSLLIDPSITPLNSPIYQAGASALVGAGLAIYDETQQKGINIGAIEIGFIGGYFAGHVINKIADFIGYGTSNVVNYITSAFGSWAGYRLGKSEPNPADTLIKIQSRLKLLEEGYKRDRKQLISVYGLLIVK